MSASSSGAPTSPSSAVLDEQRMTLQDVLEFQSRHAPDAQRDANSDVELRCGDRAMFTSRMGEHSNRVSICVDRGIEE